MLNPQPIASPKGKNKKNKKKVNLFFIFLGNKDKD